MALSFLRTNVIAKHVKNQFYLTKRNTGYMVLIPEIGEDADTNTLLTESGLPEFSTVTIEKCIASVTKQSLEYESGVQQIEQSAPNCKNAFKEVFKPLENLDSHLELTWGIAKTLYFGNSSRMPTKSYIKVHERFQNARQSKFNSVPIFQAAVKEREKLKEITDEEQRLLDKYILEGRLNGLDLTGSKHNKLIYIRNELQKERGLFRDKVNYATKVFSQVINNPGVVKDFPASLLTAMSGHSDPDKGPWRVTLQPHIYEPFLEYCPIRDLRWNVYRAYNERCSGYSDKNLETSTHLEKIRSFRADQATVLGFKSYAEMSMETKMAGSLDNLNDVLDSLLNHAKPAADYDLESLQKFAKERGFDDKLEVFDIPYWRRKQKWCLYNFDEEKIREYFPLQRVVTSVFNLCSQLFKIEIVERSNVHTWHKDVKFYDIFDSSSNSPIAGFYLDPYAREDEKIRVYDDAGWHIAIRNRCASMKSTPLSALIFNFQSPQSDKPSLLSFNEVKVFFQRFGHSLRHLLTKANYSEVAGLNNVEWDAAEVCGHVMTHWLYDPHTIQALSGHYSTDEPLPEQLMANLHNIPSHFAGYDLCKELYFSKLDLELHSRKEFWRDIVKEIWPKHFSLPFNKYDSHPLSFTKIMSEEWGGAYYSRLWSRMIAADIYSAFEEARRGETDILEVGKRYKDTFLALGGSCHPSEVFRRFRGRDPTPQALLRNLGLDQKQSTPLLEE